MLFYAILGVGLLAPPFQANLIGQGTVSIVLSNRGDLNIIGDNQSNSLTIEEDGDTIWIEGSNGTLIRKVLPDFAVETSTLVSIPKSTFFLLRNVNIDLKKGDNRIALFYFPELITGSLNCKLGGGINIFGLVPSADVEILNGIKIQGSRSNQTQLVVLGDTNFRDPYYIYSPKNISIDLKGSSNEVWSYNNICQQNQSIKTAGANSQIFCSNVTVAGKMDLRVSATTLSYTLANDCNFGGKTTFNMGNASNRIWMIETDFFGEVAGKFGKGDDQLQIEGCTFSHPKGAKFDGGPGNNTYSDYLNSFSIPPLFKNFLSPQ